MARDPNLAELLARDRAPARRWQIRSTAGNVTDGEYVSHDSASLTLSIGAHTIRFKRSEIEKAMLHIVNREAAPTPPSEEEAREFAKLMGISLDAGLGHLRERAEPIVFHDLRPTPQEA
jgi:hypothetical protein